MTRIVHQKMHTPQKPKVSSDCKRGKPSDHSRCPSLVCTCACHKILEKEWAETAN